MSQPETLNPRLIRRDIREYATVEGDLVIARRLDDGTWLVTATANDPALTQVQGRAAFNEAGFRGRQWEASQTLGGQQHPTLISILRDAVHEARARADIAAFIRSTQGDNK